MFVGRNLIIWKSKKQNILAKSSAKTQYCAIASTASELVWLKQLLKDMGIMYDQPIKMYYDNNLAGHIASNPMFHEQIKHIEVDCHFIRENVQAKEIETPFVRSEDQLADIFTKGLDLKPFENITSKLRLFDIYNPSLRVNIED